MLDRDTGAGRDLFPDIAGPHRAPPAIARLLAGDGDESEVAHRRANRLGLAIHDGDGQAPAAGGERMGEAHDTGAHDDEIILRSHAVPQPRAEIGAVPGILPAESAVPVIRVARDMPA